MRSESSGWSVRSLALVLVGWAVLVLLGGCVSGGARTEVARPAALVHEGESGRLSFWEALRGQGLATNADAVRAAVLFVDGEDAGGFGAGVRRLASLGLIGERGADGALDGAESVRVGLVAVVFGRLAGVEGIGEVGWEAGSVGEFFAAKRARSAGLLPRRSANQALTGAELMAVVRRAEIYRETGATGLRGERSLGGVVGGGGGS